MYQIISAIGQSSEPGSAWEQISVIGKSISALSSEYSEIYLEVSNPYWDSHRTVIFSELLAIVKNTSVTLEEFLVSIGNAAIVSHKKRASIVEGSASYSDAFYAGYKLSRARYSYSPEHIPNPEEADTLILQKQGINTMDFHKYCLVNVNGLFYRTDADSKYVYIKGACDSMNYCGRNEVGILSFAKLGAIETVGITKEMLTRAHPNQPFSNQIVISSPVNPGKRTAALVFGGYLMLLDNMSFVRRSEDSFVLDVQNIALLARYYESRKVIDMGFLGLETSGKDKMQISRAQLTSDETLTKWLTHALSFLVFIDTDNIHVERTQLPDTKSHGQYIANQEPKELIVFGTGLSAVYWKQNDEGRWLISASDNAYKDYLSDSADEKMSPMPADNAKPWVAQKYRRAYLTSISTQKVVLS